MNILRKFQLFAVLCLFPVILYAAEVEVGNTILLKVYSDLGVPLHLEPGNNGVSGRLPGGSYAKVFQIDPTTKWIRIEGNGKTGWIVKKYIDHVIVNAPPESITNVIYIVGTWNLEHFHDGVSRGFPESGKGGPTYSPRTQEDYETIAGIIELIDAKILVLEEVFAVAETIDDETAVRSHEVEKLISILGETNYDYIIGKSGRTQHIAMLYDTRYVRLNSACETNFPNQEINKKSLFERQPLYAYFTFLHEGREMNDLIVVGIHLASGQDKTENHDKAMEYLVKELIESRQSGWCIPEDENDMLICGDFNTNRFDKKVEAFWEEMEGNGWDVLGDDVSIYSATRLSGNPLKFNDSRIDYIIVTKGNHGLAGEEIKATNATIHTDLVSDPETFRRSASDHIPVTVEVSVMADSDQ